MKRKFLMTILALGTVGGYAWGFHTLGCHHHRAHERRAAFEQHIASVCVEAARGAERTNRPAAGPANPAAQEGRSAGDQ